MHARNLLLTSALSLSLCFTAHAEVEDAKGVQFFEAKIRPVLVSECYKCHSVDAQQIRGGLTLDTRATLRQGGDSGEVIFPGEPENSPLIDAIKQHGDLKMPPGKKLPDSVIADFERWVKIGAPDPRTAAAVTKGATTPNADQWSLRPIQNLTAPAVKDVNWPRSEIDRFILARLEQADLKPVGDAQPLTLLRRVYFDLIGLPPPADVVVAFQKDPSPEALAKIVDELLESLQFGERWGRHWLDVARFAESNGRDRDAVFPHAWRYRRYVFDAFNAGMPYDRFITEQLAGDLLPAEVPQERERLQIATGFLALGPKSFMARGEEFNMDLVDDQIDTTTRGFLGLTVSCARCHDHKFDPIPTKDYYSLAGIFRSTKTLFGSQNKGATNLLVLPDPDGDNGKPKPKGPKGKKPAKDDQRYAMAVQDDKPQDLKVLLRGEINKFGEEAPRGFLSCVSVEEKIEVNPKQSGRLELARWLTDPSNPLTSRVMANRVWHHLFGRGLVTSMDNFGHNGDEPTHPELLDHLAATFIKDGWSVKQLIRRIVLSRTYQMASDFDANNYAVDPDCDLVWRHPSRRLDVEAIRDAMLSASGTLELTPPPASPVARVGYGEVGRGINMTPLEEPFPYRSAYLPVLRGEIPEILKTFDFAEPSLVVGRRNITNVPAQSLYMMNSPFVIENATALAERLGDEDDRAKTDRAYMLALSRPATEAEHERAMEFLAAVSEKMGDADKAWAAFCQALFASAEFRYLD